MTPAPDATSPASQVGMEAPLGRNEALIQRLEEGADDLTPYSLGEVDSPSLNVALPAYLNEAAAAIRDLEAEIARLRSAPIPWATCQACGGAIEGWICQSCDREFHENDKGGLVMDEGHAPIPAVQSGAVAWRYKLAIDDEWELCYADPRCDTSDFAEVQPLYAAPQSEPLPGVGWQQRAVDAEETLRDISEQYRVNHTSKWAKAKADAILAALSGKEQG